MELWGLTTITNISKIDRLITKMARILNGTEGYGKTDQWNIKHLNWMSLSELHSFTAAKYAHKIINSDSKHWFKEYLLANRSSRNRSAMKIGPHKVDIGRNNITQLTFLYSIVNIYNRIPDTITRFHQHSLFKLWLKKWHRNSDISIPINSHNPINMTEDPAYYVTENLQSCKSVLLNSGPNQTYQPADSPMDNNTET